MQEAYDAGLLDLDGVLYRGPDPIEHAAHAVAQARAVGMRIAFVTNNASRHPEAVAAHLSALAIPASAEDVVTSAQAAVRLLVAQLPREAAVLVVGSESLAQMVAQAGFRPVHTVVEAGARGVAAVVQGLSSDTSQADLAEACVALRAGAIWIAGNTDLTLPSPRGPLPGNGAFVSVLEQVTGRQPQVAGKPDPALHLESVARVSAVRPLVVGDRLDTDVLGAVRGGADSLLVLTGVTDLPALLAAPRGSRPTYLAADLRGLGQPHTQVTVDGDRATCGAATATYSGGVVTVVGHGEDALRAQAGLVWARADAAAGVAGS